MAVPNEGTTYIPTDAAGVRLHGLWDGTNFRAWRSSTSGVGKILLANASGTEITIADDAAFTAGTSPVLPIGATYQATVDEVNANDIGAPRMTIRRGLITAGDFSILQLTSGTPAPAGSDIVGFGGGAIGSADLQIRNSSQHFFYIPMAISGWRKIAIQIAAIATFDQNIAFDVRGTTGASFESVSNLGTTTLGSGGGSTSIGVGAVGTSGTTSGTSGCLAVPAIENGFLYILIIATAAGIPTTGTLQITIIRMS